MWAALFLFNMSTPKDKLTNNQALNSKKKKFFRILQSSNGTCNSYCVTANEHVRSELEAKMKLIIEQVMHSDNSTDQSGQSEKQESQQSDKKLSSRILKKLEARKTFKCDDLIYGLNQTLKSLQNKQLAMIWLDQNISPNLINVLHKLCVVNEIYCLDLNLENLKTLLNISTLSVIGFRSHIKFEESIFNSIYLFLASSVLKSNIEVENASINITNDIESRNVIDTTFTRDIQYYTPNSLDQYSDVMRKRLKETNDDKKDEFRNQMSFISILQNGTYFPDYSKNENDYMFEIITEHKLSKEQSGKSANALTEKLFSIDEIEKNIQFHSPKLIKGQSHVQKSNLKRKIK